MIKHWVGQKVWINSDEYWVDWIDDTHFGITWKNNGVKGSSYRLDFVPPPNQGWKFETKKKVTIII